MKDNKKDSALGAIPKGKRDTQLDSKPAPRTHRKSASPKVEPLQLPRGALIAFRASGGLKFRSRQAIVFPDGRLVRSGTDVTKLETKPAKLGAAQIAELSRTLKQVDFRRLKTATGQQPPDSYAFEIVAQADAKTSYEFFDGMLPESLLPLIRQLTKLLPGAE